MPKETLFTPEPLHENIVPKLDGFLKMFKGAIILEVRLSIEYQSIGLISSLLGTIIPANHDSITAKIRELGDEFKYSNQAYIAEVIHWVEIEKRRVESKKGEPNLKEGYWA